MTDYLQELVTKKLKEGGCDKDTISLCEDIFSWHTEGGPGLVRSNITKKIKELKSQFTKEAKEIKEITPKIRKKRKKGK